MSRQATNRNRNQNNQVQNNQPRQGFSAQQQMPPPSNYQGVYPNQSNQGPPSSVSIQSGQSYSNDQGQGGRWSQVWIPNWLTSRDWFSSARPPGGTESNATEYNYARDNVKSFPELPNGCNVKSFSNSNHSKANADGDQSMASATDLFKSMTMNELAEEQHSYSINLIC